MNRGMFAPIARGVVMVLLVSLTAVLVAQDEAPPLPPGWTEADVQAMIDATTPGEEHAEMVKAVGTWQGKTKMWMFGVDEPVESECVMTITSIMDGRFIQAEVKGDLPGMGPYHGQGVTGYDKAAEQFVSTWIDNHSTGIMNGTGERSADGKTMTWRFGYHCPITDKPTVMRQVERKTGPNSMTLEMWGIEPKSGEEFKMMQIDFTRK